MQVQAVSVSAAPLSSVFHRRLLWLLSGRAIIESVNPSRRQRPRALLLAPALTGLVGLSLLVSACGASAGSNVAKLGSATTTTTAQSVPSSTTSSGPAPENATLAFSRCMRSHGVSSFPDPDSQGNLPPLTQQELGVSKQTSLAAQQACKSLLSRGGSTGTPQQRQQKLAFGLKVAQCLRHHGYPSFPDPSGSSQALPPGIDPSSSQFQTAETACENQSRKALGLA